jgi:hypothetical protein
MSKVAPVIAVFFMRWTASAAMVAGPTTIYPASSGLPLMLSPQAVQRFWYGWKM